MKKVKVIGAGSIGNHLSNASRSLGWSVDLVDVDPAALERTRTQIYPGRYGAFDPAIRLFEAAKAPDESYDLVCIGTPPDSHMPLALAALEKSPGAVLIEKPLCGPGLEKADEVLRLARERNVRVFVGYDHVVGRAATLATAALQDGAVGQAHTLDVEFREHWGGIFAAHPWLSGPGDSYLGFTARGGGASGEHSHALNLWQHFALALKAGRVTRVQATLDRVRDGALDYDKICVMTLETEGGLLGRCIQDVVTQPPRKWARVQGTSGAVEWECGSKPGQDSVNVDAGGKRVLEHRVYKTRPDDFIAELRHIEAALRPGAPESPISLERGLDTMLVLAAVHLSASAGRTVAIDYEKGYNHHALSLV